MVDPIIECKSVHMHYNPSKEIMVHALKGISIKIENGEFVVILGPSGSGKTTLLDLISSTFFPTEGEILISNKSLYNYSSEELLEFKRKIIGRVHQFPLLHPLLSAVDNISLPLLSMGYNIQIRREVAQKLLPVVQLADRDHHLPGELSGGEQQRVAIARALINNPKVLIADEPTSHMDSKSANEIMEIITRLNHDRNVTIILTTHDSSLIPENVREINLEGGKIISDNFPDVL